MVARSHLCFQEEARDDIRCPDVAGEAGSAVSRPPDRCPNAPLDTNRRESRPGTVALVPAG